MNLWRGRRGTGTGRARFASALLAAASLVAPAAVLAVGVSPANAAQGGSVTPSTPALSNTNVAATSTYTLNFVPSPSGALPSGAMITFVAPARTSFPAVQCNLFGCSGYSISASVGNATVSGVAVGSANQSSTNNVVVLTISLGLLSPNLSGTVSVSIQSVANPNLASSSYSIEESTSVDPNPVASPPYSINPGPAAQLIATAGTPQTATVGTAFQSPLVATVEDSFGNPLSGQSVQFSIGHTAGGASATFANASTIETHTTNPAGNAASSFPSANNTAGGPYSVTASVMGLQPTATFFLTNGTGQVIPGAVHLTASGTANQVKATPVTYAVPFQSATPLMPGDTVSLTLPSGTVLPASGNAYSVTVNGNQVSVTSVNLNAAAAEVTLTLGNPDPIGAQSNFVITISGATNPQTAGSYSVTEQTSRDSTPAASPSYSIVAAPASHLSLAFGEGQSANPSKPFATPLGVLVTDQYGNLVSGQPVKFAVPASGASATFPANPDTVMSDSSGLATSDILTANATPGSYQVTASGTGLNSVIFNLKNASVLAPGSVTVSLAPSSGSSGATYQVPFTTTSALPSSGGCPGNCIITLVAPNGTSFPSLATKYNVTVNNGHVASIGSVFLSESAGYRSSGASPTPNQVNIQLSSSTIAAGDVVAITITGVTNPSVASASYRIEESTTSDSQPVPSPQYAIGPAQPNALLVLSGSPQAQQAGQQFSSPLEVELVDGFGNPISGTAVSFSVPASGPTVTFATCANPCVVNTDLHGDASVSVIAGSSLGALQVVASVSTVKGQFNLTNLPGAIQHLSVVSGDSQTTSVGSPVAHPLVVKATDASLNPITGVAVVFASPSSGPSAKFGTCQSGDSPLQCTVLTDASGVATSSTMTANGAAGGPYTVTATGSGVVAGFHLTNLAGAPSDVFVLGGDGQQALVFSQFGDPLQVRITDSSQNPIAGVAVTFSTPESGATATFSPCTGGNPTANECVVNTDALGDATSSALTAGADPGRFPVHVSVAGSGVDAFTLTDLQSGYRIVGSDGGVFTFGGAPYYGSTGGQHLNAPIVGMASTPNGGYYLVATDGGIFTFGPGATFYGSTGSQHLNAPVVGMALDPQTGGYWLVASDGGVFAFNAPFWGSMGAQRLNAPIVGIAATPEGGYYLVASDGGIFSFGPGSTFYGSTGGQQLNAPIVSMATAPDGGYWLVASDGGIFNFGPGAVFFGSAGGEHLNRPIVGMSVDPASGGYWLVASDGGIFSFGAPFYGSTGSLRLNAPIVGMAPSA